MKWIQELIAKKFILPSFKLQNNFRSSRTHNQRLQLKRS
jgi:hypothetical protein